MFQLDMGSMLVRIPALLIAITFHEYWHGRMADNLGDPTPRYQGRLSLNPLVHLDPIGTIMLFFVGFGWAKPVNVNPNNFRGDKKIAMLKVAAAGPGANFFLAFVTMLLQGVLFITIRNQPFFMAANQFANSLVTYNIFLGVFNLIPIPPLDGSKILAGVLPYRYQYYYRLLEQYGFLLLMLLIITGVFRTIVIPVAFYIQYFMASIITPVLRMFL